MSDDNYEPYHWQVGDPADWGDSTGVPDIPYMGYLNGNDDDDNVANHTYRSTSQILHEEAWRLRKQGKYEEALVVINRAISHDDRHFDNWNVKAIILEDMHRYSEAIECYDEALRLNSTQTVKNNKAYSLSRLADTEKNNDRALRYINEALKLVSDDSKKYTYLHIKGNILERMGRRVDARVCYLLAGGLTDEVAEIERQKTIMQNTKEPMINVTGTRHYGGNAPFSEGAILNLIPEPTNVHDCDAIRVEVNGETVGYVANSVYTLIEGIKSAKELKDIIKPNQKAEVMFVHAQEYVIAKLI